MDKDITAKEGLAIVRGYEVVLEDMQTVSGIAVPNRAIVRMPTTDDPEKRIFGIVGPEYELVTLEDAVNIWDEHVARPIETMGLLGKYGENFFCTTWLPEINVRGEEVRNYLLLNSPMDGFASAQALISPVCTVCQNTLRLAESMALQRLRVVHDKNVKTRLAEWMTTMVEQAEAKTETLKEAFEVFAKHKVTTDETTLVTTAAYPDPKPPVRNAPDEIMKVRWENYEYEKHRVEKARHQVVQLFQGAGTAMETKARKGTLWGLYQSVTERENYRRGGSVEASVSSILFGWRGYAMTKAFEAGMEIVGARS